MATFRVNKTKNYTVVSNYHLRDKNLSLKAKGLLTVLLSLPDDWDYSVNGLVEILKEGKDGITSTLKELEKSGYLKRTQDKDENGKFKGYNYDVYEKPFTENPSTVNPYTETTLTEEPPQRNTKESSTKQVNTKGLSTKESKHTHGEYSHVLLTQTDYQKLVEQYGEEMTEKAITFLDEYIEMKGYKSKNHYLTIKKWVVDAVKERDAKNGKKGDKNESGGQTEEYKGYVQRLYEAGFRADFDGF